ncbi:hypothetical protein B0I35DRAFT_438096 [Stachybotrys elegans]|uniref:PLD phosphodiesterase domain-containing protein n=1 Tax=Stachybotrys elegans TaxID=80388 RepID=A0A8K0SIV7_9HYPO|nr:hypothetical protein B0I35DRAFT_438096 [Stachybotrys elegans]
MVSQYVYTLCQDSRSVSSEMAKNPALPPDDIIKQLYPIDPSRKHRSASHDSGVELLHNHDALQVARECGQWPRQLPPSRLFLRVFADALACLDSNPWAGMVSPSLMGTHGTAPLTIIAPLIDIIQHNAKLIRGAKKDVFFITCVWTPSVAQTVIKEALIALSEQAKIRGGRVAVKIMFDKGSLTMGPRRSLQPDTYSGKKIDLPSPQEIPHVDLQIISFHAIPMGTLHAKVCIVDGEVATVMSNNLEDNANMEMMTQLEGPIVASIYDSALITWNQALDSHHPLALGDRLVTQDKWSEDVAEGKMESRHDIDLQREIIEANELYQAKGNESHLDAVNHQLNLRTKNPIDATGPDIPDDEAMAPYIWTMTPGPVPMALVSRPPYGPCDSRDRRVPQNEAWLSLVRNAKRNIFIQTPDLNVQPLLHEIKNALQRGVEVTYYVCFGYNDAGEMIPGQGGTNEQAAQRLLSMLPPDGPERRLLRIYDYVAKDQNRPIHHSFKSRSCHIKLLIADDKVGVQGSGNQDTQSWYHSQELNVMVDSPDICAKWRAGIERNQNTRLFGRCWDGIWRDEDGKPGKGYSGDPGVVGGLIKGVIGMVEKHIQQSKSAKQVQTR